MDIDEAKLEEAISAAIDGPEVKRIKFGEHHFNVKPAKIFKNGDTTIVHGEEGFHISHNVRVVKDDQVYYRFEKIGDEVVKMEFRQTSGFWETAFLVTAALGAIFAAKDAAEGKLDMNDSTLRSISKTLLDGTWEGEVRFLIAHIAERVR